MAGRNSQHALQYWLRLNVLHLAAASKKKPPCNFTVLMLQLHKSCPGDKGMLTRD